MELMSRYMSAAERAARHAEHERDLSSSTSPVLDAIAEIIESEPESARNDNLPARSHIAYGEAPPLLQRNKIVEYAEIDGFCDAALNRPVSIAVRFTEARLHYSNMPHWDAYTAAYLSAYKRKAGAK